MSTITRNAVTAEQFRDLISAVSDQINSARSAATPDEHRTEIFRLADNANELRAARCRRVSQRDRDRRDAVLVVADVLVENMRERFKQADAMITNLAFGGGW